jgi:hypothetical protein
MHCISSRRLSSAFVLIALLGLSLPVSALGPEGRNAGVLSWIQDWIDSVRQVFVPQAAQPSRASAIAGDTTTTSVDRGALIDPNGGTGR